MSKQKKYSIRYFCLCSKLKAITVHPSNQIFSLFSVLIVLMVEFYRDPVPRNTLFPHLTWNRTKVFMSHCKFCCTLEGLVIESVIPGLHKPNMLIIVTWYCLYTKYLTKKSMTYIIWHHMTWYDMMSSNDMIKPNMTM